MQASVSKNMAAPPQSEERDLENGSIRLPSDLPDSTQQPAEVSAVDAEICRKLHFAAEIGDVELVRRIFRDIDEKGSDDSKLKASSLVSEVNELGESALFLAAKKGKAEVVKELLKHSNSEEVRRSSKDGFNPLHIAAFQGHADVVQTLLDYEPELIKEAGPSNTTPLVFAVLRGHATVVNQLLSQTDSPSLLSVSKSNGRNALHLAARLQNVDMVKALLEKEPQLARSTDQKGQNALHLAVKGISHEIVRLLVKAEPVVLAQQDSRGNTVLHIATKKQKDAIVQELLLYPETNVNVLNKDQKTALDIAEELPYSRESMKIKAHLSRNGAVRGNDLLPVKELKRNLQGGLIHNANSVNEAAVLIAQIAFAAIFTIPGSPVETSHNISVQVLVIFNSIAFFASLAVVVIQTILGRGEAEAEVIAVMAEVTNKLIWLASACISVVFMATITIVVGRRCQWATILIMVVGGALIAGSLGIKTYYEVRRLRKIELIKKKET
ncbi:ankyrin repeat-containing protein ITN1-like [Punica granatum]|uniref:Ankyrin repeat-containing protein ITN1-like n=1 Tax=Punica granatum TaxID=22663 RepID=A0A218XRI3_PUNGR|nr:ankyrin repeat-containing protein ITN1-like [Punica granatum]OWM87544.1 hypothetical protein CDL15_Pgr022656 [Punica granatum]